MFGCLSLLHLVHGSPRGIEGAFCNKSHYVMILTDGKTFSDVRISPSVSGKSWLKKIPSFSPDTLWNP